MSIIDLNKNITGLILAGGKATRMDNQDKGLQAFKSGTLVQHVIDRLAPQVQSVLINANRHLDDYAQFGAPVLTDLRADFAGPLAGLEAGLAACQTDYLLCVPCDAPFLPLNLAQQLAHHLHQQNAQIAVASCMSAESKTPRLQPVFCLLERRLLMNLQNYLDAGGRKMASWFDKLNTVQALFEDEHAFSNINSFAELRQAEKQA